MSVPARRQASAADDFRPPAARLALTGHATGLAVPRPSYHRPLLTWALVVPAALVFLASAIFVCTGVDLAVSGWFFDAAAGDWPFRNRPLCRWLYDYGQTPGIILGGLALGVAVFGNVTRWLYPHRYAGLFVTLTLIVGPGLIVNGLMKPMWGRPRPSQCEAFGGERAFVPVGGVGEWSLRQMHKSFPCGHASIGFFLATPAFLLWRRRRYGWAAALFTAGVAFGLAMGVARIAQGRHFASDVLWSAAVVYFTALALYPLLRFDEIAAARRQRRAAPRRERGRAISGVAAIVPFSARRPEDLDLPAKPGAEAA